MKKRWFLYPILILLGFLLFSPKAAFAASKQGLLLWFQTLLPSLLPFMILSNILVRTNVLQRLLAIPKRLWGFLFGLTPNGMYALFLGIFCGYPMGAKVTADLLRNQRITQTEASYLLSFVNHPGPMFVSSFILLEMFQREDLQKYAFIILYTASFVTSLVFRKIYRIHPQETTSKERKEEISSKSPIGEIIDTSIMNGFEGITKLGGYIILFSVFSGWIASCSFLPAFLQYILLSITEITTGSAALVQMPFSQPLLFCCLTSLCAFGGLCIMAQTKSMLQGTSLSLKPYILGKLCCTAFTFLLSGLFVVVFQIV